MARRILVVENDRDYRELLHEIVEGLGFDCLTAESATAAIKVLRQEIVSLILLDIKMPNVHGDDFLQFIRKKGSRVPAVIVSGYLTPEVLERVRAAGIRHVIAKPFKVQRLSRAISQMLAEAP